MPVAVVGYLVPLIDHTRDETLAGNRAALLIAADIGVVVVFHAAPGEGMKLPRLVGIILRS